MSAATKIVLIGAFMAFVGIAATAANQGFTWGRIVVVLLALALVGGFAAVVLPLAAGRGNDEDGAR